MFLSAEYMSHILCAAVNDVADENHVFHDVIEAEVIANDQHPVSGFRQKLRLRNNTKFMPKINFATFF